MSETQTLTLTEFLLARIAEDEGAARAAADRAAFTSPKTQHVRRVVAQQAGAWDSARILAECEVKRSVIRLAEKAESAMFDMQERWSPTIAKSVGYYKAVLEVLALPYADHPDYREGWKP